MPNTDQASKYGAPWSRDELILAFELYCRIPFKKTKANNPEVIHLARLLRRSPAAVARKLGNFGSFDPDLRARKISGLSHVGRQDRDIWNEFINDWNGLILEASRLRQLLDNKQIPETSHDEIIEVPAGESEKEAIRKTRIHQAFFRSAVLSSYDETCCITGLRITECLIASHIVPWSVSEKSRTDPRNGLCLSATFDRLFDRGLLTLTDDYRIIISSGLHKLEDMRVNTMICQYHEKPIFRPRRFLPLIEYLTWHRTNRFHD